MEYINFNSSSVEKLWEIALTDPNKKKACLAGLRLVKLYFINKSFSKILEIAKNKKMPLQVREQAANIILDNSSKKELLRLACDEDLLESIREKAGMKIINEYAADPNYLSVQIILSISNNEFVTKKVREFAANILQDVIEKLIQKSILNNDLVCLLKLSELVDLPKDLENSISKALEKFNYQLTQKVFNPLEKDGILLEAKIKPYLARSNKEQNQNEQKNINKFNNLSKI